MKVPALGVLFPNYKPDSVFSLGAMFDKTDIFEEDVLNHLVNSWNFPSNGSYGNVHFTPIWYPNGNYTVSVTLSDLWTPAGMITKTVNTNTIRIIDSAYDDWHVGR